jgi:HK97 family phage major capsid protein
MAGCAFLFVNGGEFMPDVNEFTDEKEWMAACVPKRIEEGDTQEQAVGACMGMWSEKKSVKFGSRHNTQDRQRIRSIRNLTFELEPNDADPVPEEPGEIETIDMETLIAGGKSVKALGEGKMGGYLVTFSDAANPDLEGDYFTKDTDFGDAETAPVYYQHGLDPKLGRRRFGKATHKTDEIGVWAELQLQMRDDYEQWLYAQAEAGRLGWSSGTASHLVEREATGKTFHIKSWPLGLDDSLTLTPAEPRNTVIPLKSLSDMLPPIPDSLEVSAEVAGDATPNDGKAVKAIPPLESMEDIITMEITEEKFTELMTSGIAQGVEQALKSLPATPPPAAEVKVVFDPADHPFDFLAEQARAVKTAELSKGRDYHPRLTHPAIKGVAGQGASEAVPTEAGYLLEPTFTSEILKPMHETGPFTSLVQKLPVGSNSNAGWINGVDETDRATGSRWGGLRGYRLAEGDTITASKPKFRRINWELRKYALLVYATDELLQDVSQFSAIVNQGCGEELSFMANDDILNGLGTNGPLGILGATTGPAYVSITKETNQTADTIVPENLSKMWARLDPRGKKNATWFINTDCNPQLDNMALAVGTGALEPRFVNYGADGLMRIKGRPVVETEFSPTVGDAGCIMLADMSQYLFWEKGGVQAASSIHIAFATDETAFRFTYRCYGCPVNAVPLTPYKGSATISPFVILGTV